MVNICIQNFLSNFNCSAAPSGMVMEKKYEFANSIENDIQQCSAAGNKSFIKSVFFSLKSLENDKL